MKAHGSTPEPTIHPATNKLKNGDAKNRGKRKRSYKIGANGTNSTSLESAEKAGEAKGNTLHQRLPVRPSFSLEKDMKITDERDAIRGGKRILATLFQIRGRRGPTEGSS